MISVVIPAYNEEKAIAGCLDSLVAQKTRQDFEVIIVNNNSTDKTEAVTKTYINKINLIIVQEKIQGRGAARAKGFSVAKGEIVLGTEADTQVPPNWIETIVDYFNEQRQIIAVTGTCKFTSSKWQVKLMDFFQPLFMRIYRPVFGHYWLSGFNFGIRKSIYLKAGGFNKTLNTLDDIEFGFRVSKLGKILFMPSLPVVVSGRRFEKSFLKGFSEYIISFIEMFLFKKKQLSFSDIR
jgi:glycosyltransferase involved in cell wall biosynthesis